MNADPIATPNRPGVKSRELVLDAAERVMAQHGYDATSVALVVEESAFRSAPSTTTSGPRTGCCSPSWNEAPTGSSPTSGGQRPASAPPVEHLQALGLDAAAALERHAQFLRLLIVFATQPPAVSHNGFTPSSTTYAIRRST
ncbi:MAG: helix-turn-helix domain-containing protein [Solirubrobacteraceae bacterium]